jgi:hypothetical protein
LINLDAVIPAEKVIQVARQFLQSCSWSLELGDTVVDLPPDLELVLQSRAYVSAEAPDIFLGNHYEAVVLLGREIIGNNWVPLFGSLRLYFNLEGQFISEDRLPIPSA